MKQLPYDIIQLLQQSENAKLAGEHQKAIDFANEVLLKKADCVEALEEIADNYLSLEDMEAAEKAASFAVEIDKKSYTAFYILGFVESRRNDFKKAIEHLEKANILKPNHSEILRSLGWAYFMDNKQVKGVVILERALNLNPDDVMILCDLGICYVKVNKPDKALDLFYRAMEITPNDVRIRECIKFAQDIKTTSPLK